MLFFCLERISDKKSFSSKVLFWIRKIPGLFDVFSLLRSENLPLKHRSGNSLKILGAMRMKIHIHNLDSSYVRNLSFIMKILQYMGSFRNSIPKNPVTLITVSMLVLGPAQYLYSETNNYYGDAFDQNTGQKVYSDNHSEFVQNGKHISSNIEYKDSTGKVIGRKTISFAKNTTLPDFKLEDLRDGYIEGAEFKDGKYKLYFRKNSSEPLQEKILDVSGKSVSDGGFDQFVKENWDSLSSGKKLKFRFYAPSQLDSFKFAAEKVKNVDYEGRPSMVVKMEMDNLLLNIFIPPIFITYDLETKRILFYEGISNVNNAQGKSYFVKLKYYHFK